MCVAANTLQNPSKPPPNPLQTPSKPLPNPFALPALRWLVGSLYCVPRAACRVPGAVCQVLHLIQITRDFNWEV